MTKQITFKFIFYHFFRDPYAVKHNKYIRNKNAVIETLDSMDSKLFTAYAHCSVKMIGVCYVIHLLPML